MRMVSSELAATTDPQGRCPATEQSEDHRPRVVFIVGPTGVGKSELALELAMHFGGEIVNADSRQLYRGLDIGTAKPPLQARRRVPHHLIDIADPAHQLDVSRFARLAREAIAEINGRGRLPIVSGGSGMYLKVLRHGLFKGPGANRALREQLLERARSEGPGALHEELRRVDPVTAGRLAPNDLTRIVRALEVFLETGVPLSAHQAAHRFGERPYRTLVLGLTLDRKKLYDRINQRFIDMMSAGLADEVAALKARGFETGVFPLDIIGYKEIARWLDGDCSRAEAIAQAQRATRRLAKRQLTYFRADSEVVWIAAESASKTARVLVEKFLRLSNRSSDG